MSTDTPGLDDVWTPPFRPGDYMRTEPLPETNAHCPNCGRTYDDEWTVRHLSGGPQIGETWLYTCPKCNNETLECGT